jgi:hypothetical protein
MTLLESLKHLHSELLSLRKFIADEKAKRIYKRPLLQMAEQIATAWFSGLADQLNSSGIIQASVVQSYSNNFGRLIEISAPGYRKASYVKALDNLSKKFRDDLILPIQKRPISSTNASLLTKMLANLPSPEEDVYLREAINCASKEYFRAAVVLGWCAAIDRIHRIIEKIGFTTFNVTSALIASQTQGRFKKFSSPQNIGSLSEMREVFDTVVLWVIEGMQLIDSNQHTRLKGCFDLRCQCAHPGDAPVTEFNLLSFFSDLNEIVFRNPKFNVK